MSRRPLVRESTASSSAHPGAAAPATREWLELLTRDVHYWMPLTRGPADGATFTSLFYEDHLLLKVRIERLRHPNAFSQQQPSFCQHVLQQPALEIAQPEANRYVVRTPFMYFEAQLDSQLVLAG